MDGFTSNLVVCKENYGYRFVDVCFHQVPCGADAHSHEWTAVDRCPDVEKTVFQTWVDVQAGVTAS